MPSAKQSSALREIRRIHRLSESRPDYGLDNLDTITKYLFHPDEDVRYYAIESLVVLSWQRPFESRGVIPEAITRLDDESAKVRTAALTFTFNLGPWFPEDFVTATDIIVKSARSNFDSERSAAAAALSAIAVSRPDIVTPSDDALEALRDIASNDSLDEGILERDLLVEAKVALYGGDLPSRDVERDLVPTPNADRFSQPARIAFKSLYAGIFITVIQFVVLANALRFAFRHQNRSASYRMSMLGLWLKRLKFFFNWKRGVLYLRSSSWPTFIQVFPFFKARCPMSEDPTVQTDGYPDDWDKIALAVRRRDGYQCRNCRKMGGPMGSAELHVDHAVPLSRGGDNHPFNLRTLCRECHEARHARTFD